MIERLPFSTDTVRQINDHIQERLAEVEANFGNEAYPADKPRAIDIKIVFEPDKSDATEITTKIFSECKLPKRLGKKVNAVIRDGKILVEIGPEETPLFPNTMDGSVKRLKQTLKEAGATMSVVGKEAFND